MSWKFSYIGWGGDIFYSGFFLNSGNPYYAWRAGPFILKKFYKKQY